MIKIAVCDDEDESVNQMEDILEESCERNGIRFSIDAFYGGEALEKEIFRGTRYDMIFLNMQMKNGESIVTAGNIRKIDDKVLFICVSNHERCMVELLQLELFAFIKKQIQERTLVEVFNRATQKVCNNHFYFSFCYRNEEYKVLCKDILYFESCGRKVNVYKRNGEINSFNGKLSEVEKKLLKGKIPFMQIHQSYLVNYYMIKARSKTEVVMENGIRLSISADRRKVFAGEYSRLLEEGRNV